MRAGQAPSHWMMRFFKTDFQLLSYATNLLWTLSARLRTRSCCSGVISEYSWSRTWSIKTETFPDSTACSITVLRNTSGPFNKRRICVTLKDSRKILVSFCSSVISLVMAYTSFWFFRQKVV